MDREEGQRRNTVFMRETMRRRQALPKLALQVNPNQVAEHVIALWCAFYWQKGQFEFSKKRTLFYIPQQGRKLATAQLSRFDTNKQKKQRGLSEYATQRPAPRTFSLILLPATHRMTQIPSSILLTTGTTSSQACLGMKEINRIYEGLSSALNTEYFLTKLVWKWSPISYFWVRCMQTHGKDCAGGGFSPHFHQWGESLLLNYQSVKSKLIMAVWTSLLVSQRGSIQSVTQGGKREKQCCLYSNVWTSGWKCI